MPRPIAAALLALAVTAPAAVQAQAPPAISGTLTPGPGAGVIAPAAPSYGYQPYDPGNPTGFYHPDNMGFGHYQNPTKLTGHRSGNLNYRRFRGY